MPTQPASSQQSNGGSASATASACSEKDTRNEPIFRIRLHPQGNKESNKDFTFFQVFCSIVPMKYRAKFTVYNANGQEVATTVRMLFNTMKGMKYLPGVHWHAATARLLRVHSP